MKNVHFIGICGKGMSAVAKLLIDSGYKETGSDEGFYPPVSTYIEKNNIPFIKDYKPENIGKDVDTVVIGKHASLVKEQNQEVAEAFRLKEEGKVHIKSFPEILEVILKDRESIGLVGSYGKSTCTALMAHLLLDKYDIGYMIGATPTTPPTNAELGTNKMFVIEGDEYPSSNWDSTSKFMYYGLHDVLLTSLAHDHINIFKTHEDFKKSFYQLIKTIPVTGKLFVCIDDESIGAELQNLYEVSKTANIFTYSTENTRSDYYAQNISYADISSFEICKKGVVLGTLETRLLGKHNIQNIVGVVGLVLEKELMTIDEIRKALLNFEAVEQRLNPLKTSPTSKVKIYEGFGSSVDKAKSAISAMRLHFPDKKLKVIFEPYTFSWRNRDAISWYDEVFLGVSKVYVYEPPTHGANTHAQLSQQEIVERIEKSGINVEAINHKQEAIDKIYGELDPEHDIILTLSPSNIGGIPAELAQVV